MRVAIITESFPPDVNGVAHCVLRVAELLTGYGHHPLVIVPRSAEWREERAEDRPLTGQRPDSSFPFPVVRVPAVPLPGYRSFRLGLPSRLVRAALIGHRADVVHLASPVFLGAHGAVEARRLGLPVVAVYQTDGLRTSLAELGAGYLAAGHEPVLVIPGERDADEQMAQGRVITLRAPRVPFTGGYRVLWRRRRLAVLLARLRPDALEVSDRTTLRWTGACARARRARRHDVARERHGPAPAAAGASIVPRRRRLAQPAHRAGELRRLPARSR